VAIWIARFRLSQPPFCLKRSPREAQCAVQAYDCAASRRNGGVAPVTTQCLATIKAWDAVRTELVQKAGRLSSSSVIAVIIARRHQSRTPKSVCDQSELTILRHAQPERACQCAYRSGIVGRILVRAGHWT